MDKPLTITKYQVELYKIRKERSGWADITIDSDGCAGRIQIASDWGAWQRYWGSCGVPFKKFLVGLNIDYAANKFGADQWFDLKKTIKFLKCRIREYADTKSEKKELLLELLDLENSSCKEEFIQNIWNCPKIMKMEDHSPNIEYAIDPAFKNFWEKIWIPFTEELKSELHTA